MSQFYSDMITWSVVGLAGGAVLLGHIPDPSQTGAETGVSSRAVIVAAAPAASTTMSDAVPQALPVVVAESEPVIRRTTPLPQIIEDADLREVSFTGTGTAAESRLPVIEAPNVGTVTGQSVNLRAGPGTSFQIVSRAVLDDELIVTGEREGIWVQVLAPITEEEAWIHGDFFRAPEGV